MNRTDAQPTKSSKDIVAEFWSRASCGELMLLPGERREDYRAQMNERYRLEPYIIDLLQPSTWKDRRVLEIGIGLGADHQLLAEAGAHLSGIDLTERAVAHTARRLAFNKLKSDLRIADAEDLPFPDGTFDCVVAYGAIHHSPNPKRAAAEILRVLKPGGAFRVMVYHRHSLVGLMLWLRYGWWQGLGLHGVFARYSESPGTKAFTIPEIGTLFPQSAIEARVELTHADLLCSNAGQRHSGLLLTVARKIWPRRLIKRFGPGFGNHLLIDGQKYGAVEIETIEAKISGNAPPSQAT